MPTTTYVKAVNRSGSVKECVFWGKAPLCAPSKNFWVLAHQIYI